MKCLIPSTTSEQEEFIFIFSLGLSFYVPPSNVLNLGAVAKWQGGKLKVLLNSPFWHHPGPHPYLSKRCHSPAPGGAELTVSLNWDAPKHPLWPHSAKCKTTPRFDHSSWKHNLQRLKITSSGRVLNISSQNSAQAAQLANQTNNKITTTDHIIVIIKIIIWKNNVKLKKYEEFIVTERQIKHIFCRSYCCDKMGDVGNNYSTWVSFSEFFC